MTYRVIRNARPEVQADYDTLPRAPRRSRLRHRFKVNGRPKHNRDSIMIQRINGKMASDRLMNLTEEQLEDLKDKYDNNQGVYYISVDIPVYGPGPGNQVYTDVQTPRVDENQDPVLGPDGQQIIDKEYVPLWEDPPTNSIPLMENVGDIVMLRPDTIIRPPKRNAQNRIVFWRDHTYSGWKAVGRPRPPEP